MQLPKSIIWQAAWIGLVVSFGVVPWIMGPSSFSAFQAFGFGCLFLLLSVLTCWTWRGSPDVIGFCERLSAAFGRLPIWGAFLVAVVAGWFVAGIWLQGFPIADDVYAAMMQAETFASGKLVAAAPPVPEAFSHNRFVVAGEIWVSQYTPGWALLLTPFALLDIPFWLAPAFFGAGSLVLFWRIARRRLEPFLASLALVALCTATFFILNASTAYSHASTAFFGLAAVEAILVRRSGGGWAWASLAGAMLGAMGVIRPFNAVLFVTLVGGVLAIDVLRARNWQALATIIAFGFGGLPFALGLLGYHYAITGSALTTIPEWLGKSEPLGMLGMKTVYLTLHRIGTLAFMTSPLLVVAGALVPFLLLYARRLEFTDLIFPMTVVAFLFYGGDGGTNHSYGPRYLFEAFPYLILSLAVGVSVVGIGRRAVRAALATHLAIQIAGLGGWLSLERSAIKALSEPFRLARQEKLENALVILEDCPKAYRKCDVTDFTRNGLDPTRSPVVYALDLGDGGVRLRDAFPDRIFWVYRDGALKRLDADAP